MNKCFQQGLLSAMVISLVACGGGGGGGSNKSSTPASSVAPSSVAASSVAESSTATESSSSADASSVAPSSMPASSVAPSSTPALSSSSVMSSSSSMSSSSAPAVETTFTVRITPPQLDDNSAVVKSGRTATANKAAEESLPLNQLAVVVVDLAGNVVRTIPLDETNSTQNPDGSWSIRVPGYPQLDCIVIADLDGPITVFEPDANVFADSNLLFAPTTGEDLEVSLASTAAYQNFLDELGGEGTFESLGLDVTDPTQLAVLNNLIETVQEVLADQVFVGATSIAAALAQVDQQVTDIVQVETTNIQTQLDPATNTLAAGLQASGIYWFEAYEPSEIYYGGFTALNAPEQEQYYDGDQFQPVPEYELDGEVVLTATGWVTSNDIFQATALNQDGSVNFGAADAPTNSANAKATQVIDLSGRTISTFFSAYGDTRGLVPQINPASSFAEGALGYRVTIQSINDLYTLWYNTGYDFGSGVVCLWDKNGDNQLNDSPTAYGGNCETVNSIGWNAEGFAQSSPELTTIASLTSPDLAPGTAGAKLIPIDWPNGDVIGVQLLDDANKTARFYLHNWFDNTQTQLGTGTWSQLTLPNLTGDAASAIGFEIPASVRAEGDFDEDERYALFAVHDGFVRRGDKTVAGEVLETSELLINGVAKDNLLAAFDYQPAIAGSWVIGGDYLMFRKDGTFAQVKVSNDDPNCQLGMAYGSYSWNPVSGAFSVELDGDNTAVDSLDSCSVSGIETATINGTSMTMTEGVDTFVLTKITPSESAPLAGAWAVSGAGDWFTFTAGNNFIHAKIENDDSNCQIGWANGSFTWNVDTNVLSATVAQDFTDNFPETTCTLEGDVTALQDGNTLSVTAEDDEFILKRFGNPLN